MHIGLLTQYFPPEMGAPQARLSELGERFVASGHEVSVLTAMPNYPSGSVFDGYGGVSSTERLDGMHVIRSYIYPTTSMPTSRRLLSYSSFAASSVAVGVRRLPRVDYLLTESPPLFLGASGFALSRLKKARWIFNVSDLWPDSAVQLGVLKEGRALRMAERLERFCYEKAWLVTGQSREIVQDIHTRFPAVRTHHLSNGVDSSRFRPEARDPGLRSELAPDASVLVAYAGLHGLAQGLDQVLDAAAELRSVPGLRFILVGDGPEKAALVKRARELGLSNVSFHDPILRDVMPRLLASADIALVPLRRSLKGAVPSKLYEAMASAVPVVLVSGGEASQIVRESNAGLAVRPGDASGLVEAIKKLAADESLRKAMGEAGRVASLERYSRDRIAEEFITLLESESA